MKKRIYKINNKNLVTGNPNEVTENEILVKENNDGTVELSHRNNGTLETLGSGGTSTPTTTIKLDGAFSSENVSSSVLIITLENEIDVKNLDSNTKLVITENESNVFSIYILNLKGGAFSGYVESENFNAPLAGLFLSKTSLRLYVMS